VTKTKFQFGIDTLLAKHADWLRAARVGLVAHAASVDAAGVPSAERLRAAGVQLTALFGPEHGFAGQAVAGEEVGDTHHPAWNIPIHSLYGAMRKPTSEMLANLDIILFDLQDLGVRCYTYCATLRNVLAAAAEHGKAIVILDRPIPLAGVVDGPLPQPDFMSFVAAIPAPFCYGLTPGQAARWLCKKLQLDLDLRVAPFHGAPRPECWIPPSPAIRAPLNALAYPATVLFEAFPAFDVGRKTAHAFRGLENHEIDFAQVLKILAATDLPGVEFELLPHGLRLAVTDLARYRPALSGVALVQAIQQVWGAEKLWQQQGARPGWFDKLMGTDRVRQALQAGAELAEIGAMWEKDVRAFRRETGIQFEE